MYTILGVIAKPQTIVNSDIGVETLTSSSKNYIVGFGLDTKDKNKDIEDLGESKFAYERSLNFPLLYFVDENIEDIAKIILRYININCTEKERQEIIEQNS